VGDIDALQSTSETKISLQHRANDPKNKVDWPREANREGRLAKWSEIMLWAWFNIPPCLCVSNCNIPLFDGVLNSGFVQFFAREYADTLPLHGTYLSAEITL